VQPILSSFTTPVSSLADHINAVFVTDNKIGFVCVCVRLLTTAVMKPHNGMHRYTKAASTLK